MLYSQFFIEDDRYVISTKNIIEIVPNVGLKASHMLPEYAAGLLNYHGAQVPVIDVCHLLINRPCKKRLSTRIIIINGQNIGGDVYAIGFMVERATETLSINDELFQSSVMQNPNSLVAGDIVVNGGRLITRILVSNLYQKLDKSLFSPQLTSTKRAPS